MASYRASITMARTRAHVPANFSDLSDIQDLFCGATDLATVSRRGWLSDVCGQLFEMYGLEPLAYLSRSAAVIESDAVRAASDQLAQLIEKIRLDPDPLYTLTGQTAFPVDELLANLQKPANLAGPTRDEGDGDDVLYLAWFLRAHLAILEHAQTSGYVVLYGQTGEN